MIKSMTGFGRCESLDETLRLRVEIRSVNHRFLDMSLKMPKKLNAYESVFRSVVKQYASRGKIDVFLYYEELEERDISLQYNEQLARSYMEIFDRMKETAPGIPDDMTLSKLAFSPDVIIARETEQDVEAVVPKMKAVLEEACRRFEETRIQEGVQLKADLLDKLTELQTYVDFITERSPKIIAEYRGKLTDRIEELLQDTQIDDSRIAMEVTIYADKICVDEELVRLSSHVKTMRDTLEHGTDIGRKLDFIAQEMNREANTILSKSNDLEITNCGIDLKTCIEKIREQVQNVE